MMKIAPRTPSNFMVAQACIKGVRVNAHKHSNEFEILNLQISSVGKICDELLLCRPRARN